MSETVRVKGKLELQTKTAKEIMTELGKTELPDYFENWEEYLSDECYEEYVSIDDNLYKINNKYLEIDFEFYEANRNNNGTIEYHCMYYDGGCSLDEAIKTAVKNIGERS